MSEWCVKVCAKQELLASVVQVSVLQRKQFLATSCCSTITMPKVRIRRDMIKSFSGKGDVVAWLKNVRLHLVDDVLPMWH